MSSTVRDIAYRPSAALNPSKPKEEHPILGALATLLCILLFFVALVDIAWWDGRFVVTRTTTYVVHQGDTIDGIASRFDPNVDVRKPREWIINRNGLQKRSIQPGELLVVPVDGKG